MKSISHRADLRQGRLWRAVSSLAALPGGLICGTARAFGRWIELRRQMRALAALDDHLLRDIGLTDIERRQALITPARRAPKSKS